MKTFSASFPSPGSSDSVRQKRLRGWKPYGVVFFAALLVLGVQLLQVQRPFRGHFASYQATVMASIARNMVEEDFKEILLPKTNLLIVTPRKSYHLNQYPFPSLLVAVCVKFLGGPYEVWGRLQAILFNLLGAVLMFRIGARLLGRAAGLIASLLFLMLPFSVIYGQMFLCEPMAVFFLLASVWLLARQGVPSRMATVMSALCFSLAIANRTHYLFFFPALLYFLWIRSRRILTCMVFLLLGGFLPAAWAWHTFVVGQLHPLQTHTNLFFQAGSASVFGIRLLAGANYWRYILDLFSNEMLTPAVFPFVLLGLAGLWNSQKQVFRFFLLWTAGGLVLIFLAPKKIIDQDFYLYGLYPALLFLAACGIEKISDVFSFLRRSRFLVAGTLLLMAVSARYFVHPIFQYPKEEKDVGAIGAWVQKETSPGDIVILSGSSAALLNYYVNRPVYGFSLQKEKVFSPYFMNRSFQRSERDAIEAMKAAMHDDISLLEYLRGRGAGYLLASSLDGQQGISSRLLDYLKMNYSECPPGFDGVRLFNLRDKRQAEK
ncbi:MAG: glycosyltransferase family 39 protein [Candidatus Omnitrophota bacterium]